MGLIVIVDSIKESNDFIKVEPIFNVMKRNNIWKIVIGAVSAALGYILNAIGL